MVDQDAILRAYSMLASLKQNVPDEYEVSSRWVDEFHQAVEQLERSLGKELRQFRVPQDALERSIASSNYVTGEVHYREGLWCRRHVLMQKIDALLFYFTGLQSGQDRKIGFQPPQ